MKIIYIVHDKFNDSVLLKTESETEAYDKQDELNSNYGNIDPCDLPFCISSEFIIDIRY